MNFVFSPEDMLGSKRKQGEAIEDQRMKIRDKRPSTRRVDDSTRRVPERMFQKIDTIPYSRRITMHLLGELVLLLAEYTLF